METNHSIHLVSTRNHIRRPQQRHRQSVGPNPETNDACIHGHCHIGNRLVLSWIRKWILTCLGLLPDGTGVRLSFCFCYHDSRAFRNKPSCAGNFHGHQFHEGIRYHHDPVSPLAGKLHDTLVVAGDYRSCGLVISHHQHHIPEGNVWSRS